MKHENRSSFLLGDIHNIPCKNETLDLVISRSSTPLWDDWNKAYFEIFRILKIGGQAYIGGGFGNAQLSKKIKETMKQRNPYWKKSFQKRLELEKEMLPKIMENLNPTNYEIINNESGFWVYFTK